MFLDFNAGSNDNKVSNKHTLIDDQTSPLQRIMWVYNDEEPQKRTFENNVCTFHIGNGYFLSVAHNLRLQAGYFRSIDVNIYKKDLLPILDGSQTRFLDQQYFTDDYTGKKYLNTTDPAYLQQITNILKQKRFDTRWVSLADKKICRPYLIFQFKNNSFYNDSTLTRQFKATRQFYDKDSLKHTFLIEVELVNAFYNADIALYRIVDESPDVISKIPAIGVNFDFLDDSTDKLYCLQSSPAGPAGRLLNDANIEGILDHFNVFPDDVGGNYFFEGYRYLVKGYFRFGSSGAPYLFYDNEHGRFMVNAIQSEASGIQLSIKNDREGNFQYINAIASPLYIIKDELQRYITT